MAGKSAIASIECKLEVIPYYLIVFVEVELDKEWPLRSVLMYRSKNIIKN